MSLESHPIYSNGVAPPVQSFSKSDETPAKWTRWYWSCRGGAEVFVKDPRLNYAQICQLWVENAARCDRVKVVKVWFTF